VRLLARAVEVIAVLRRLQINVARLGGARPVAQTRAHSGRGLGVVEAARGRLVHQLDQRDGIVTHYRILAPTEWNFHPRGVLVRALLGLGQPRPASLKARVRVLVTAVDPCVDWELELRSGELSDVG
jgi:coenzyme F420-reducing hydrogenase alpha subunit